MPQPTPNTTVKQKPNKNPAFSTQLYLRIAEIHDDTLVLKNGGLRAILEVGSVNMNLKSEQEQNALVAGYQGFLNALEFPVQLVARSKKLDISDYLASVQEQGKKQKNGLLKRITAEYMEYVRRLVEFADIMEKHFYIVVPQDPLRAQPTTPAHKFWGFIRPADTKPAFLQRRKEFGDQVRKLNSRVDSVMNGITNIGLPARRLATPELIRLFYDIYNPHTARNQKVGNMHQLNLANEHGM